MNAKDKKIDRDYKRRMAEHGRVVASPLYREIVDLARHLSRALKRAEHILETHGDGCDCHFCTSQFTEDGRTTTEDIARRFLHDVAGIEWSVWKAFCAIEPELSGSDQLEEELAEVDADQLAVAE
jgi:hypothetical protein